MNGEFFGRQVSRLQQRFGNRAFDQEFCDLIWREVYAMKDAGFQRLVDNMIGSRPVNKPPLIVDFREGRLNDERTKFERDLQSAVSVFEHPAKNEGLRNFLDKRFGKGCKNLAEAIEIRRLQIKARKAEDPSYDPNADPEWQ